MKKLVKIFLLILFFIVPFSNVFALNKDYKDLVYKVVEKKVEEGKINLYLFHSDSCSHCAREKKFLKSIEEKYPDVNIYMFEVSKNIDNSSLMKSVKTLMGETENGVPFTVVGEESFLGYNEFIGNQIEKTIQKYLEINKETEKELNTFELPIIGKVDVRDASIPLIAIVLGLIDGFNPCAMWVLLFLINMFFGMKNKKKMFILGYTFLFTSGLVYFLSMLGITFILDLTAVKWLQILIAIVAIVAGILNIKTYIKTKDETGCHVVDAKKRKSVLKKTKNIVNEKNIFLAIIGVIALAISVNLVELACSLGFPAIFSEILALNNITGALRIIYLLIYVLFYLIDDLVVFTIAVCTLSISTRSTKYTKYVNLIAGIIMILMGILLIFKPEWVMLNF